MSDALISRPSSQIQRVPTDHGAVYRKHYVTDDWGGDDEVIRRRAATELHLIKEIAASGMFGRRLGVVRVASSDPSVPMIETYEVAGQTLEQQIHSASRQSLELFPWFLAGRWLQKLHRLPVLHERQPATDKDPESLVDYCALRIESLRSDFGYPWPKAHARDQILRFLSRIEPDFRSLPRVWAHSDYAPGNLLWGSGVLTPIDFAMARTGTPLDDATYLIHRLEMAKIYRPWLRAPVRQYRRAILSGLGMESAFESDFYRALMVKHLVCRIHTYVRRPARDWKQSMHDRWVRRNIRSRLDRLVA